MGDWLLNLPVVWMAVVVFAATYLLAASIYWVVITLAVNERARAFKALSTGMLPPLGILFALLIGFIAVEVWGSFDKAKAASYFGGQRPSCCRSPRRNVPRTTEAAHLCSDQPSHKDSRERGMASDGATASDSRDFAHDSD